LADANFWNFPLIRLAKNLNRFGKAVLKSELGVETHWGRYGFIPSQQLEVAVDEAELIFAVKATLGR
jgi:hypothetical protein